MFLPRAPGAPRRYHRNKAFFALGTFLVVYALLRWLAPDLRDDLQGFALRTPGNAFRERRSGDLVQARARVEEALRDSTGADGDIVSRWRVRSLKDHPFTVLVRPGDFVAQPGDTVRVRGFYDWDTKGGVVNTLEEGWVKSPDRR